MPQWLCQTVAVRNSNVPVRTNKGLNKDSCLSACYRTFRLYPSDLVPGNSRLLRPDTLLPRHIFPIPLSAMVQPYRDTPYQYTYRIRPRCWPSPLCLLWSQGVVPLHLFCLRLREYWLSVLLLPRNNLRLFPLSLVWPYPFPGRP